MKYQILVIILLIFSNMSFIATAAEELTETDTKNPEDLEAENEVEETNENDTADLIKRHIPNVENKRSSALLHHMRLMSREDEVINLTNAKENFYGLYLPHVSSQPQGAILILHDKQQHGHWPAIIGPLREYLPLFGWNTLTIELPYTPKRQRIEREDFSNTNVGGQNAQDSEEKTESTEQESSAENDDQDLQINEPKDNDGPEDIAAEDLKGENPTQNNDDNEPALPRLEKLPDIPVTDEINPPTEEENLDLIEDYQSQNRERINTAIDYLHQKNQYNLVLIGFGQGASWAIDYVHRQIKQDEDAKGLTLITIDASPNPYDEDLMYLQLTEISLPYLDLLQNKKRIFDQSSKKRLGLMRRNNNTKYQQIVTQEINGYHQIENPTNRRIRGWIKKNAGGTQIPIKVKP